MKRAMFFVCGAGAVIVLAAACTQDTSDRALVNEPRILAVRAEPPEVMPGATVRFDALVVDPKGGRAATTLWGVCTPDLVAGVSSCAKPGTTVPLGTGTAQSMVVDAHVLDALPPADRLQGIDLYVVLDVHYDALGAEKAADVVAFKRLNVSTNPSPNHNPHLVRFDVAGDAFGDVAVPAGSTVDLTASTSPDSLEKYVASDGTQQTEDVRFTWLESAGEVADSVTYTADDGGGHTTWTAKKGAPPAILWVVARDPRGGIDWMSRNVVAP